MRTYTQHFIARVLAILLIIFACAYLYSRSQDTSYHVLTDAQEQRELQPVGELTKGVRFVQFVRIPQIKTVDLEQLELPLCLELLMANYRDRENFGTILLGIALNGRVEALPVAVEKIRDNIYHRICLDEVSLADFYTAHEIRIVLEGVDSKAGHAVTAWSTTDISRGHLDAVDDELIDRSLVFRFGYYTDPLTWDRRTLILTLLSLLAVYILIAHPGDRRQQMSSHCEPEN